MALFFSLNILEAQSCNNATKFLDMLEFHYTKRLPRTRDSKSVPSKVPLNGNSFILNPRDFFNDKTTDIAFKVQYVKLAGRRDYNLYKQYGYKALNTSFFPDINYDVIKLNPLLSILTSEVHFKYEELI